MKEVEKRVGIDNEELILSRFTSFTYLFNDPQLTPFVRGYNR